MTPIQKIVADFILSQTGKILKMSIIKLAMEAAVRSESSIVHFYRMLGFSGYNDFKVSLATEIAGKSFYYSYDDITINDDISTIKQKIFQGVMKTLHENISTIQEDTLINATRLIEKSERLIFIGYAASDAVAMDSFLKFSRLGFNCHFSFDSHTNAIILSEPKESDVIFCISHSGESKDVVAHVKHTKPPAKIIALTGNENSTLGRIADVCVTTVSEEMNYRTDAMVSRIVQTAIINTLYTSIGVRKGPKVLDRLAKTSQSLSYLKF
jgi:RpiR family carbohydrate utilization transcriptional regulator